MPLSFSDQVWLALIDKLLIGIVLAIAGYAFSRMLESFKSEQARALDELRNDLTLKLEKQREQRVAIGDFVKKISVGYQAMEWFTWTAKNNPNAFSSQTEIDTYNDEMRKVFPEIVAARVALAAVDVEHEVAIKEISDTLFDLDVELAKRIAKYKDAQDPASQSAALKKIGDKYDDILVADEAFVKRVSGFAGVPNLTRQGTPATPAEPIVERRD
jgi:hypothetical protein